MAPIDFGVFRFGVYSLLMNITLPRLHRVMTTDGPIFLHCTLWEVSLSLHTNGTTVVYLLTEGRPLDPNVYESFSFWRTIRNVTYLNLTQKSHLQRESGLVCVCSRDNGTLGDFRKDYCLTSVDSSPSILPRKQYFRHRCLTFENLGGSGR